MRKNRVMMKAVGKLTEPDDHNDREEHIYLHVGHQHFIQQRTILLQVKERTCKPGRKYKKDRARNYRHDMIQFGPFRIQIQKAIALKECNHVHHRQKRQHVIQRNFVPG